MPKKQPEDKYGRKAGDPASVWTSIGVGIDKATSKNGKSQGVAKVAVEKVGRKRKNDDALAEAQEVYVNTEVKGGPKPTKKKGK